MKELKTPEIEREEKGKEEGLDESISNLEISKEFYNSEMEKLKSNPMSYICDWAESNLLYVGKRAFELISLLPCSNIIPTISFKSTGIKANINAFLLGAPACGKSTITKMFLNFSYFPMRVKGISAKELISKMCKCDGFFSLGIDDFSNLLEQPDGYEIIKILEGALGDEKYVSHENKRSIEQTETQAIGLICGTWVDLKKYSNYLKGGLLSRMSLFFISLKKKQMDEILEYTYDGIGKSSSSKDNYVKQQIIKDFYENLFKLQADKSKQIKGYKFDSHLGRSVVDEFKKITKNYKNDINGDFKREFHDFFRYLVSHSFLNIYNRKVEDGILHLTEEDYKFAKKMMLETLRNKIKLIKCNLYNKSIKSPEQLMAIINSDNFDDDVKNILLNLSPYGKVLNMDKKL